MPKQIFPALYVKMDIRFLAYGDWSLCKELSKGLQTWGEPSKWIHRFRTSQSVRVKSIIHLCGIY